MILTLFILCSCLSQTLIYHFLSYRRLGLFQINKEIGQFLITFQRHFECNELLLYWATIFRNAISVTRQNNNIRQNKDNLTLMSSADVPMRRPDEIAPN